MRLHEQQGNESCIHPVQSERDDDMLGASKSSLVLWYCCKPLDLQVCASARGLNRSIGILRKIREGWSYSCSTTRSCPG